MADSIWAPFLGPLKHVVAKISAHFSAEMEGGKDDDGDAMMPVWDGKQRFQDQLRQYVELPLTRRELFFPVTNPVRWGVAVYGREGHGKRAAVETFLSNLALRFPADSGDLQWTTIDVEYARTGNAMECVRHAICNADVIVIDHADVLAFTPDNEKTMLSALSLVKDAEAYGTMVIGLFDRTPAQAPPGCSTTEEYRALFFRSFQATAYFAEPHDAFRQQLWRWFMQHFERQYALARLEAPEGRPFREVQFALRPEDYVVLSMCSAYASPEDIRAFCATIFYDLVVPGGDKVVVDMTWIQDRYMKILNSERFISETDYRFEENAMSEYCGFGPIPGLPAHMRRQRPQFDQPDPEATTGMSKDLVDPKAAKHALRKKRGLKKRTRAEEEDEAADAAWNAEAAANTAASGPTLETAFAEAMGLPPLSAAPIGAAETVPKGPKTE
jgi:hypothetical protein